MNVLKKIASAVAAVAVLAGISVPVGAADSTLKLLTEEVDSEFGSLPVDGLLCVLNENEFIDEFVSIPQSALKKWRSGGNLDMTDVEVGGKVNWDNLLGTNDNSLLLNVDSDGNIEKYYAIDYNGKDKIDIVRSSSEWMNYMNG